MKVTQEQDKVDQRFIVIVALVALAVTAVGVLIAWWLLRLFSIGSLESLPGRTRRQLQEVNAMEMSLFRQPSELEGIRLRARARLLAYGWVDRDRRLLHVPIERSFDLYLSGLRIETGTNAPEQSVPAKREQP